MTGFTSTDAYVLYGLLASIGASAMAWPVLDWLQGRLAVLRAFLAAPSPSESPKTFRSPIFPKFPARRSP